MNLKTIEKYIEVKMKHVLIIFCLLIISCSNILEKDPKFELTKDELKFILAKIAQVEFKGVEIEFTYNLIIKLQEHYKYLSKTQ